MFKLSSFMVATLLFFGIISSLTYIGTENVDLTVYHITFTIHIIFAIFVERLTEYLFGDKDE